MIHLRDYNYSLGDKLSLSDTSMSPYDAFARLKALKTQRDAAKFYPIIVPVETLLGFDGLPSVYTIATQPDVVGFFVNASTDPYRCAFSDKSTTDEFVFNFSATSDSIVFLPNKGRHFSVMTENTKTAPQVFVQECQKEGYDPITIWFLDTFGLLQSVRLEKGAISFGYDSKDDFESFNGELGFELPKKANREMTVGDESIQNVLKDFLFGFVNSLAYGIEDANGVLKQVSISGAKLSADYYSGLLSVSGVLRSKIGDRII